MAGTEHPFVRKRINHVLIPCYIDGLVVLPCPVTSDPLCLAFSVREEEPLLCVIMKGPSYQRSDAWLGCGRKHVIKMFPVSSVQVDHVASAERQFFLLRSA
jgi:hypothetical protein